MRVLIATGIYPPDIGGPATMIEALGLALKKEGFELKVLTYSDNTKIEKDVFRINRRQNTFIKYLKYFGKMLQLSRWADVLYVTDTYSVGYFAYLIKKLTGKKYIVRFAGDSAWEMAYLSGMVTDYITNFEENKYPKTIEKLKNRRRVVMVNSDKVIAVSDFLNKLAQKIGVPSSRVVTIYNSIDFQKQEENARIDFKKEYGENSRVVITSCRLVPWKGVGTLIKIMPDLIREEKNIHLVVLGDGPLMDELIKSSISLGVSDYVHFMGRVKQEETSAYIKNADLFVLNTYYEGLSHVILEAIKAEVPIVTTRVGGNPEVINDGENGILVEYNNEEQLKEGIKKILENPNIAVSFVKNASEKLTKFNWENTKRETIKVIKSLQ